MGRQAGLNGRTWRGSLSGSVCVCLSWRFGGLDVGRRLMTSLDPDFLLSRHLHPQCAMPSIISLAFGLESCLNLGAGTVALVAPEWCLAQVVRHSSFASPTASLLVQTTGSLLYALTTPLLLCLPDSKHTDDVRARSTLVGRRRLVYYTLGAQEACLIPLLLWNWAHRRDSGMERGSLLSMALNLVPFLGWRVWCLWWRPQWFAPDIPQETQGPQRRSDADLGSIQL
jgi:hypothetical protein